jgi:hypothetical protein
LLREFTVTLMSRGRRKHSKVLGSFQFLAVVLSHLTSPQRATELVKRLDQREMITSTEMCLSSTH